jgi:dTDP-4-dehydrorhamnose reductase
VFDGKRGHYQETDIPIPLNRYAQSKLDGEKAVLNVMPNSLILRADIYGWNLQNKLSLAEWILSRLRAGERVPGFQNVLFSPILVNDLATVLMQLIAKEATGIFHVGGSTNCSKYEFARTVAKLFGFPVDRIDAVEFKEQSGIAPRPRDTTLLTSKIEQYIDHPMPSLEAGLKHFKRLLDDGWVEKLKGWNQQQTSAEV